MSITTATELWRMSSMELADAIKTSQVSSQEVIEAHLCVTPIATDIPRRAGTDLKEGAVAEDLRVMRMAMVVNTLGYLPWRFQSASETVFLRRCR
jgi:hypothetical protein